MKRLFVKYVICGMSILMVAAPGVVGPSFSEVIISGTETTGIRLEDRDTANNPKNATVQSGAFVNESSVSGGYALWGKEAGWSITVEAGATLSSEKGSGILLDSSNTVKHPDSITNYGSITGGDGIQMQSGTVVNKKGASIVGTEDDGVEFRETSATAAKIVINEGTISGKDWGVYTWGANSRVENKEGGIIQSGGTGVRVAGGEVVNEKGAEIIAAGNGVVIGDGGGTVTNGGSITGRIGIWSYGSNDNTLDNSGTIIGTAGNAVLMGGGNDTARLRDGSDITGNVDADDSTDATVVSGTDDKAYLTGSGTIKNGTLLNFETIEKSGDGTWSLGGDLSSGKSISVLGGALKLSGTYTHEAGATYTVGAGSDGKAGKITADTAVLNGGTVSVVTKGLKGGSHTIVETTNGLTGTFGSLTVGSLGSKYKEMSLSYDAKNSYLNVRSNFKKLGHRRDLTSHLDDTYNNSPSDDMVTVADELFTLPDAALSSAFDEMSGTTHGAGASVAPARQGAFYQNVLGRTGGSTTGLGFLGLNDRESDPLTMLASGGPVASDARFTLTRDGQKLPYGMWIKGYSVTGNRHGDDTGSRYDYTIGGAIAGFDYLINPNIRAGVAVGYSKTSVDMKELQDNSDVESFQGAIYGSYVPTSKNWYVDAAFAYSKNSYETKRYLNFGNIYRVARGSYNGSDISGYLEGGYRVPVFWRITATPLVSFLAMRNHTDSFTETGAGSLNLETNSNNTDSYQSGVGVKLSRELKAAKSFTLTPEFGAKWLHEFGDTEANINARFAEAPAGSFVITNETTKRDAGVFSLNLTAKKGDMLSFFVGYDLGITSDQISHGFTGGLRFNW